jgi:hypothetical protein
VPDLSVIIPVYNRGEVIRYTFESVRRASHDLDIEVIVVDDGSTTPAEESIRALGYQPTRILRQQNQGLLFARLAGLRVATGDFTLFLDSDDLVSAEKFRSQLAAMRAADADVSYTDSARAVLTGEFDGLVVDADAPSLPTDDAAEFFIQVQPPPHSPVFRTDYLQRLVEDAFFSASPLYNSVAEIWFYHNAAPRPARVVKVSGPHTIIGMHPGARLTNNWEKLGVASLAVMEAFARTSPTETPAAQRARELVAEKAFQSWRKLPRDFSPEFDRRLLDIWRRLSPSRAIAPLGGKNFRALARLLGPEQAGRVFRRLQNRPYAACRTVCDEALAELLAQLPPPA